MPYLRKYIFKDSILCSCKFICIPIKTFALLSRIPAIHVYLQLKATVPVPKSCSSSQNCTDRLILFTVYNITVRNSFQATNTLQMALRFGYYENGTCCTQIVEVLQHSTCATFKLKFINICFIFPSNSTHKMFTASLKPECFMHLPPPHPVPKY